MIGWTQSYWLVIVPFATSMVFSQTAEALGGSSGWAGAGLLGLVLAWLLGIHLPSKDKQHERMIEGHRLHVESVIKGISEASVKQDQERRADFRAALDTVTMSWQKETERVVSTLAALTAASGFAQRTRMHAIGLLKETKS